MEVAALAGHGKVEIQCTAAGVDVPHGEIPGAVKAPMVKRLQQGPWKVKPVQVPGWPKGDLPFSAATKVDNIAFISGNQGTWR